MTRCCTPGRAASATVAAVGDVTARRGEGRDRHRIEQVGIPAGTFLMGNAAPDEYSDPAETPEHEVRVAAFAMDATTVTNADFRQFVEATGHVTDAERFGCSAVFHLAVAASRRDLLGSPARTPWWLSVAGADWRHPGGRHSTIEALDEHPVVHVSWQDAIAYCRWAGRQLPSEAQWERAARGGRTRARYPWGDEAPDQDGQWRCNIWQGRFPEVNTAEDGWRTTAPVRTYAPNDFGLWQMVGNVWEWCHDHFDEHYYARAPHDQPAGPATGELRALRGGSWLCHDSYCNRYRNAARIGNTPDSSSANMGFRTVADPARG